MDGFPQWASGLGFFNVLVENGKGAQPVKVCYIYTQTFCVEGPNTACCGCGKEGRVRDVM